MCIWTRTEQHSTDHTMLLHKIYRRYLRHRVRRRCNICLHPFIQAKTTDKLFRILSVIARRPWDDATRRPARSAMTSTYYMQVASSLCFFLLLLPFIACPISDH